MPSRIRPTSRRPHLSSARLRRLESKRGYGVKRHLLDRLACLVESKGPRLAGGETDQRAILSTNRSSGSRAGSTGPAEQLAQSIRRNLVVEGRPPRAVFRINQNERPRIQAGIAAIEQTIATETRSPERRVEHLAANRVPHVACTLVNPPTSPARPCHRRMTIGTMQRKRHAPRPPRLREKYLISFLRTETTWRVTRSQVGVKDQTCQKEKRARLTRDALYVSIDCAEREATAGG